MTAAVVRTGVDRGLDAPLLHARTLAREGRITEALAALSALEVARPAGGPHRAGLVALRVECLLAQGEVAAAATAAVELADLVVGPGAAHALHARGELASALDDHEGALALHLAAGAAASPGPAGASAGASAGADLPWRVGAALSMVRCGRSAEADELARTELALATARGDDHATARALRTLATTAADGGAVGRLEQARALLGADRSRRLAAQVGTDLAGLLLLGGDPARALVLLREAEQYAVREDLWPLQSRVRRLLERLGETPLRLESEALALLTTAERRVAVLALDGLTNRLIAEQLLVSVKAVEGHLSRVYRKLGVTSRAGLIAAVGRTR